MTLSTLSVPSSNDPQAKEACLIGSHDFLAAGPGGPSTCTAGEHVSTPSSTDLLVKKETRMEKSQRKIESDFAIPHAKPYDTQEREQGNHIDGGMQ